MIKVEDVSATEKGVPEKIEPRSAHSPKGSKRNPCGIENPAV